LRQIFGPAFSIQPYEEGPRARSGQWRSARGVTPVCRLARSCASPSLYTLPNW